MKSAERGLEAQGHAQNPVIKEFGVQPRLLAEAQKKIFSE